jgi:predicted HTH transcriptional regulator
MAKGEQFALNFESTPVSTPVSTLTPDEIFDRVDEAMLRQFFKVEDSRLEKKPPSYHARELGDYFSMWANTAPDGGIIIVGIRNDTIFEGCASLSTNQLNTLELTGVTFCPDAVYTMKKLPIRRDSDGQPDFLLAIRVRYHDTKVVRTTLGRVFIRKGDSIRELKGDAIRFLQSQKGEVRFETEPCSL